MDKVLDCSNAIVQLLRKRQRFLPTAYSKAEAIEQCSSTSARIGDCIGLRLPDR